MGATLAETDESALALSGGDLRHRLLRELVKAHPRRITLAPEGTNYIRCEDDNNWVVSAQGSSTAHPRSRRRWGDRKVLVASVELVSSAEKMVNWIETTRQGWVFMCPTGGRTATLQLVIPTMPADSHELIAGMLGETRWISTVVAASSVAELTMFDGAPALADELCRPGLFAAGGEAMSLDPLCGDGTGYAARQAILAACCINAITDGTEAKVVFSHYRTRLRTTLLCHIEGCLKFYDAAGFDTSWGIERYAAIRGIAALKGALGRLPGFELGA